MLYTPLYFISFNFGFLLYAFSLSALKTYNSRAFRSSTRQYELVMLYTPLYFISFNFGFLLYAFPLSALKTYHLKRTTQKAFRFT